MIKKWTVHGLINFANGARAHMHSANVRLIDSAFQSKMKSKIKSIIQSIIQSIVQSRVQVLYLPRALSSPSYVVNTIFLDSSMLAFTQTGFNAMFGDQFAKPLHHQHGIFVFMETHQRSVIKYDCTN